MKKRVVDNHMLPFLWIRGEDEETLREYVGVIQAANCNAFCIESRPHPDFCGPQWWRDMDILIEEAKKRGMKIWILDDSHFPTGYANGALKEGNTSLCRQSVFCHTLHYSGRRKQIKLPLEKLKTPPKYPQKFIWKLAEMQLGKQREFSDDQILSVTAYGPNGEVEHIEETVWEKPSGIWEIVVCGLSRNLGPHRNYINMMEKESCRLLIDEVYESHWTHYKEEFGKTIAGFFSDEPELGNFVLYAHHNVLGTHQDLPWSKSLALELEKRWGKEYAHKLPLLWLNDRNPEETAKVRVEYMDAVTRLVQKNFSMQIGDWCREHGVMYIGHVIEDDNTHTCTGASLGHYFRGLYGQDMSGIDNIGGQVMPYGEDVVKGNSPVSAERDGEFYHYMLAKLAVSAAQLEPHKKGRAMCEIFGNYGWGLSMREMKYMADHFLVRGINYFVPHAFSMADFPDQDCPPHFYAHGNNPLYRHAGELFGYMNRVADYITGGNVVCHVAILYNAEAEWADAKNSMLPQKIGRVLYDNQVDYTILPIDYLEQAEQFDVVIVPACTYLPQQVNGLKNAIYIDRLPEGFEGKVVALNQLKGYLESIHLSRPILAPANHRVRILHYQGEQELFMLVNEGQSDYSGEVKLPVDGMVYGYDAWEDKEYRVEQKQGSVKLQLESGKSLLLICEKEQVISTIDAEDIQKREAVIERKMLHSWKRSMCTAKSYPAFGESKDTTIPEDVAKEYPEFSGYIRYETEFEAKKTEDVVLTITDARDSVEVFLNGESLGIQLVPPFTYDLSGHLCEGKNILAVEVATTAARDVNKRIQSWIIKKVFPIELERSGLIGEVSLDWREER